MALFQSLASLSSGLGPFTPPASEPQEETVTNLEVKTGSRVHDLNADLKILDRLGEDLVTAFGHPQPRFSWQEQANRELRQIAVESRLYAGMQRGHVPQELVSQASLFQLAPWQRAAHQRQQVLEADRARASRFHRIEY